MKSMYLEILNDFHQNIIDKRKLWLVLARVDLKQKYQRTILGRIWLLLIPLIQILIIGPVYAILFNKNLDEYLLYLTIGLLIWNFISNSITELSTILIHSESYLLELKINVSRFIFKVIYKNIYILINTLPVLLLVILYNNYSLNIIIFSSFIGLFLTIIDLYLIGIVISLLSIKYRDIPILITNILNLLFLVTPVFWSGKDILSEKYHVLLLNPFYHMLESIRLPIISNKIPYDSFYFLLIFSFILLIFSEFIIRRLKYKVVYLL